MKLKKFGILRTCSLSIFLGISMMSVESFERRAVVISNLKMYVPWSQRVSAIDPGIEVYIYHSDKKHATDPRFVPNDGLEAMKYISFILENFNNLPEHTLFLHGHEKSYHSIKCYACWNGKDIKSSRADCQISATDIVLNWNWSEPCFRPVPGKITKLSCNKLRRNNLKYLSKVSGIYSGLTRKEKMDMCSMRGTGNAQFGVSKSCILRNPRQTYENIWHYLKKRKVHSEKYLKNEKAVELENFWMFLFSRQGNRQEHKCLPNMNMSTDISGFKYLGNS